MNKKLIKMNEQESLALVEALKSTKITENLKRIEANKSNTRQILNRQIPRFLSVTQTIESTSEIVKNKSNSNASIYKLRRSVRVMHADNLLVLCNNEHE